MPGTTTRSSYNDLPDWLREYAREAADTANRLTMHESGYPNPYVPYRGEKFSAVNDLERQAFSRSVNANPALQKMMEAEEISREASRNFPELRNSYMNSYNANAINPVINNYLHDSSKSRNAREKFFRQNHLPGKNYRLVESEINPQILEDSTNLRSEFSERGYEKLQQRFNQDQARLLEASQAQSEMASLLNLAHSSDINTLLQGGAYQRALEERPLQAVEEDYRRAQRHPYEELNFLIAALNGVPYENIMNESVNRPEAPRPSQSMHSSDYAGVAAQAAPQIVAPVIDNIQQVARMEAVRESAREYYRGQRGMDISNLASFEDILNQPNNNNGGYLGSIRDPVEREAYRQQCIRRVEFLRNRIANAGQ